MRYAIFSDIHSNLEALEAALLDSQNEHINVYLCIGDIVGYGANPNECLKIAKGLFSASIAGNHDWGVVGLLSVEYFSDYAKAGIYWTQGNLGVEGNNFLKSLKLTFERENFILVHGTLDRPKRFDYMVDPDDAQRSFLFLERDICFIGHTHMPGTFTKSPDGSICYSRIGLVKIESANKYIINVGSVGQPRDADPKASYCIYDTDRKQAKIKRVSYDVETARKKIIEAGLPRFLGDRLLIGT